MRFKGKTEDGGLSLITSPGQQVSIKLVFAPGRPDYPGEGSLRLTSNSTYIELLRYNFT